MIASPQLKVEILVVKTLEGERFVLNTVSGSVLPESYAEHKPRLDAPKIRNQIIVDHSLPKRGKQSEELNRTTTVNEINSSCKITDEPAEIIVPAKHLYLSG